MDEVIADLLQNADVEDSSLDNEFYVSISKAAKMTGLSPSQIRYFEEIPGINIGKREGPNARNRVYTKQDIRLLKWVYRCKDIRPAEMAQIIKENQKEIFEILGQLTLPQMVQHEVARAGRDALVSGLVTILFSIWQEAINPQRGRIQAAILGPQKEDWRKTLLEGLKSKETVNLENALVIWSTEEKTVEVPDLLIFFSHQAWYLPPMESLNYNAGWLPDTSNAFSVVILWKDLAEKETSDGEKQPFSIELDEPKQLLTNMLLTSLSYVLNQNAITDSEPISVFSRSTLAGSAVLDGLSLLLETCIRPFFPDCYAYIAEFGKDNQLEVLRQTGERSAGYIAQFLDDSPIIDTHQLPWWIKFAKDQVGIALDRDASRRPESLDERGSVVCIPLIGQDQVIGVLSVENTSTDPEVHCLASRQGIDGPGLLRYLSCISEIAANYLVHRTTSFERAERVALAYTRYETTMWHWSIYQQGGLNYSSMIDKILDWVQESGISREENVDISIIDVANDGELAKKYKGFDIIIDLVQKTLGRIQKAIQSDPAASTFEAKKRLHLFEDPVTDHLVMVTVGIEKDYLLVLLERIRRFWQAANDPFIWNGEKVSVSLQVGFSSFPRLAASERGVATQKMRHHFWELSHCMLERPLSENILEYDPVVVTKKVMN